LQAEKLASDQLIRELTPLEGIDDVEGLKDYLQNVALKAEVMSLHESIWPPLTSPADIPG
jgi:hypothetical protein